MKKNLQKRLFALAFFFVLTIVATPLAAQCPMCKATAQSNMQNGGTAGRGLNTGIIYMLLAPYLLVGGVGYWWWRNRKRDERAEAGDLEG